MLRCSCSTSDCEYSGGIARSRIDSPTLYRVDKQETCLVIQLVHSTADSQRPDTRAFRVGVSFTGPSIPFSDCLRGGRLPCVARHEPSHQTSSCGRRRRWPTTRRFHCNAMHNVCDHPTPFRRTAARIGGCAKCMTRGRTRNSPENAPTFCRLQDRRLANQGTNHLPGSLACCIYQQTFARDLRIERTQPNLADARSDIAIGIGNTRRVWLADHG